MGDERWAERIEAIPARTPDLETVLSILEGAARWLASRGIDQWGPESSPRQRIVDCVERGEVYLFRVDGRPVGTLVLQWSDEETWGGVADDAGYVHGLVIRREWAGRGLGRALLKWAEDRAAAAGREYLRLDCAAENRALSAYYERAGFRRRGQACVFGLRVCLYEKPAGASGAG